MSRQKSARGAKAAPAPRAGRPSAAGRPAARGVYVQQPKSDIFVVMLSIALGSIVLGCLLLFLVWSRYEFKTKPTASLTPAPASIAGVLEAAQEALNKKSLLIA